MVETKLTELGESRVRVDVAVPAQEVNRALEAAARSLARDMRLPGFRKGKVPAPVVIRRIGREAVLDEAVRERLGGWYVEAVAEAAIVPVGEPEIKISELPGDGEPMAFTIEIGVRPEAKLAQWRGVEAPRREPQADEELLERELEQVRERLARLEAVDRAAADGDFVVLDVNVSVDGEPLAGADARGQLVQLGAGRLIPGFEEGLLGVRAGETRTLDLSFPEDYNSSELAGRPASFEVSVSEVREKLLAPLDDELASQAGFDTLEELREDIRAQLLALDEREVEREFREAVIDVVADAATMTIPEALAQARAREAWERTLHSLSHRGISKEGYLQIAGRSEEELLAQALPDAERSLRREAVIAAVVDAEQIEPSDEELLEVIAANARAEESGRPPDPVKLLAGLRRRGELDRLRDEVAAERAVDAVVAAAKPITPERAAAREKLWTPGS